MPDPGPTPHGQSLSGSRLINLLWFSGEMKVIPWRLFFFFNLLRREFSSVNRLWFILLQMHHSRRSISDHSIRTEFSEGVSECLTTDRKRRKVQARNKTVNLTSIPGLPKYSPVQFSIFILLLAQKKTPEYQRPHWESIELLRWRIYSYFYEFPAAAVVEP